MVALWLMVQGAALVPSATADPQGAPRAASAPAADSTSRAAGSTATGPMSSQLAPSGGIQVFTWGNVAALVLLLGGGAYALYLRQEGTSSATTPAMQSVGQFSLGPSQRLHAVACGDEVLLLGVTEQEVTVLKTYTREAFEASASVADDAATSSTPSAASTPSHTPAFADLLRQVVRHNSSA